MLPAPFHYTPDHANEALSKSQEFIEVHGITETISKCGWIYQWIGELIPQTTENLWSGHFFPFLESREDIEISFNLCLYGFYKQSMVALRSALELGLLSVYWNLNDDGHIEIKNWLHSREDTPRLKDIWTKLGRHPNFQLFQQHYDIKERLMKLNILHNYVHTKGGKYSNRLGYPKPNFQTFEERGLRLWLGAYEEVVKVVSALHIAKYPQGTVFYDFPAKFGIDIPSAGLLEEYRVECITGFLGEEVFDALTLVARNDPQVTKIMNWVKSLPDITEEGIEEQIRAWDKFRIENMGFAAWEIEERKFLCDVSNPEKIEKRICELRKWAEDNGYDKPKYIIDGQGRPRPVNPQNE